MRFPLLRTYPVRFPIDKISIKIAIFPIFQQHFSTNRQNSKQTRKLLYYHAKLGYYHGNSRLLPDSIISPQSPYYQRHQKHKKERPTNHSGEPLYAQKTLILSHSSILSPASIQIPMALFLNSRLCRRQPSNRHPIRRAGHICQTNLMAEFYRRRITAMFPADT